MKNLLCILAFALPFLSYSQTIYEAEANPDGIIFPRMTIIQRNALTPVQGQCMYNRTTKNVECWDGTNWRATGPSGPVGTEWSGWCYRGNWCHGSNWSHWSSRARIYGLWNSQFVLNYSRRFRKLCLQLGFN